MRTFKSVLGTFAGNAAVLLFIVLVVAFILRAMHIVMIEGYLVSKDKAIATCTTQGFSQVKVVSRTSSFMGFKGGGDDDKVRFTVEAVNPIGKKVTLYVYAGWPLKGATIRTP